MDVSLLSPLAGLAFAATRIVPALRDWRRGEEDVLGVLEHAGYGALSVSVSVAAMSSTPAAVFTALLFGGAAAADTRWGRSALRRFGLRSRSRASPELPPDSDVTALPGGRDRASEDAPQ